MVSEFEWGVVSAADTGAHHIRERIWILAYSDSNGRWKQSIQHLDWQRQAEADAGNDGEAEYVADSDSVRELQQTGRECDERDGACDSSKTMSNAYRQRQQRIIAGEFSSQGWKRSQIGQIGSRGYGFGRWPTEPGICRVVNGMANRAFRIKCLGNGQVPRVRAAAWELLYGN